MDNQDLQVDVQELNIQAAMLIKAGNLVAAKEKLDKAIELDPMVVASYRNYGDLHMAADEYKAAKGYYKKAILVEKIPELYFLYGNACFMNDEVHEGLEAYNQAIASGYDSDEMLFFMGMAYEHTNDDRMALRYFQRACAKNPSRPDFLIRKISVLVRLGMEESAEESIEQLIQVAPEMFDGYHMKTQLLISKGKFDEAIEFSKAAVDRFPADSELMFDYVKCVSLTKNFALALSLIESAKKMKYFGESKRAFLILEAQVLAESGDYEKASSCCDECIATEDDEFYAGEARFLLMNFALVQQNLEKALSQAESLVAHDAEDSYYFAALYYKAFCLMKLGKNEEARKAYKEAISIYRLTTLKKPGAIDVYLYRAMCLKDLEEYDKALEMLDFVLGLNTEVAEVYALKADIYAALGKNTQADGQREKAYLLKPDLRPDTAKVGE